MSREPETGRSIAWNRGSQALIGVVFAVNVYRAITQSITIDEAFTYQNFVSKWLGGLTQPYDANNHMLNSLLSWLSISLFGLSEWALRLPSVIAGGIYLFVSYRICDLLFGKSAWAFITTALLVTNPFLLDHLSAARGYGMALAFLMLTFYQMLLAMRDNEAKHLYLAGIFGGLAVAANLTSVFLLTACAIAFIAITVAQGYRTPDRESRLASFWASFVVPAAIVSFVIVIVPVSKAAAENFYFGGKRLADSVTSLADLSLMYRPLRLPGSTDLRRYGGGIHDAVLCFSILVFVFAVLSSVWYLRKRDSEDLQLCLFTLSYAAVAGLIVAAHFLAGLLYPLSRTGLYFIPLTILTASLLLYRQRRYKAASYFAAAIGCGCLALFVLQANTSYYAEWRFDAGTKRIAQFIRAHPVAGRPLVVRASWVLEPSLNFYRVLYKLNWTPLDRSPVEQPADVRVLTAEDRGWIQKLHLKEIYSDSVSGTVVTEGGGPRVDGPPPSSQ